MSRMRGNYCRSLISLEEPLPHSLWISLDLHGILAMVWTPTYSVVSICVCWPPKRRVYSITSSSLMHRMHLAQSVAVSASGSAPLAQTSQPDPPTFVSSFSVMVASLVEAAASSTISGSTPANFSAKPAAPETPSIQLGSVPSETS